MCLSSVPYVLRRARISWAVMSTCRGYIEFGVPGSTLDPGNSYWYLVWVMRGGGTTHNKKQHWARVNTPVWLQHTPGGDFQMSQHRSSSTKAERQIEYQPG